MATHDGKKTPKPLASRTKPPTINLPLQSHSKSKSSGSNSNTRTTKTKGIYSVSVLVDWMRLNIERYIQVVRECAVRDYWCVCRDTLNCSIVLLLTDASGSSMVRGKNKSL